jgi:hypothetical protein
MDCLYNGIRNLYDLFVDVQEVPRVEAPAEVITTAPEQLIEETQEKIPNIVLRQWTPQRLKDHTGSTSLIVGKRAVGKTTLGKHRADQVIDEDTKVLVFSPVGDPRDYALNVHTEFHDKYESDLIDDHIKNKKTFEGTRKASVILLDDALYNPKAIQGDNNLLCLMMNARGLNVHSILIQQYVMGLTPQMRANMDYVFLFRETSISNRRKIYEQYAGMFPSYELFSKVFDDVTKNYGCMVIDNTSCSDRLEDHVFWYKVPV